MSIDDVKEEWELLGKLDPYWAVLTSPDKKNGRWDKEEFFRTGFLEVESLLSDLSLAARNSVLDFGCGVGRLSRALSFRFAEVKAVDISTRMLGEAEKVNSDRENIEFIHNAVPNLSCLQSSSMDLIYSRIVLQHMPPDLQLAFVKEFCRICKAGGYVVFQIPIGINLSRWQGWVRLIIGGALVQKIRARTQVGRMRMCMQDRRAVEDVLHREGMEWFFKEDDSSGPAYKSLMFYAHKKLG